MTLEGEMRPTAQRTLRVHERWRQIARGGVVNNLAVFAAALVFLAGCASPDVRPPAEQVAGFKRAYIVAMETSSGVIVDPRPKELSIELAMTWTPTLVLAGEAKTLLQARGMEASIAPEVKEYPGIKDPSDPHRTREDWGAPVRAWLNDDGPVAEYRQLASGGGSFVMEIGSDYRIQSGGLLLVVWVKLVEPSSGRAIGRARDVVWGSDKPKLPPLEEAFANDAAEFRAIYSKAGREVLRKCFRELGLLR